MSHSFVAQSVDTGNCRWTWLHLCSPSGFEFEFDVFLLDSQFSLGSSLRYNVSILYITMCSSRFLVSNKISLNTQEDLQALRSWLGKCPHLKGARQGVRLNISKRFWFHLSIEFVSVEISKFIGDVSDDAKLLQFLRGCKFSLERTKEKLDLYNSCRWKVTLSLSIVEKKKVLWSCTLSLSFPSEQAFLTGSSRGTRQRRSSRRFSASGKSKAVFLLDRKRSKAVCCSKILLSWWWTGFYLDEG